MFNHIKHYSHSDIQKKLSGFWAGLLQAICSDKAAVHTRQLF